MQETPKMDPFDEKIVRHLSRDGRLTNAALAERVGLSASACHRRVSALERSGVIAGYRAVIDRAVLGTRFVAYVAVGLRAHDKESQLVFERAMRNAAQVTECHNVTGAIEYILRVEVEDLVAYKAFHMDVLGTVPGVVSITSHIVMQTVKAA